jgi:beta-galactosidase
VRGEVGILFVPEANLFNSLQQGSTEWFAEAARGAYQGFFDLNAQPDWLHVDHLFASDGTPAPYRVLYLPYPVHLRPETAQRLASWVELGGTLVREGCPGYFGARGRAGTVQPNLGLDAVFGAREHYVEFAPDVAGDVTFSLDGVDGAVPGALFLQAYQPAGGRVAGAYAEGYGDAGGLPAAIDHTYGKGRTRLIGTFPGVARHRAVEPVSRRGAPGASTFTTHRLAEVSGPASAERLAVLRRFFAALLDWAGVTPHVRTDNPAVVARLHRDAETGTLVLWALNPTRQTQRASLTVAESWGSFGAAALHWGETRPAVTGSVVDVEIPARDAVIARLEAVQDGPQG